MPHIRELAQEWRDAGGTWIAFHQGNDQGGDLIPNVIAARPGWKEGVKGGVCFAASCVFLKERLAGKTPEQIDANLRIPDWQIAVGQKQIDFKNAKTLDEKFAVAHMKVTRKFNSGVTPRPSQITSRQKLLTEINADPGLYIFEAFNGGKGHVLAFDTRSAQQVFFFDANWGIFHGRPFAAFRDWYTRFWEGTHDDGTTYKKSLGGGSRVLLKYELA